jgi:plastocyanin
MIRALARTVAATTLAAMISACGSSSTAPQPDNGSVAATADLHFTPAADTIARRGQNDPAASVTWVFGSVSHTVTWDAWPEGASVTNIGSTSNASVTKTFYVAGTYTYHCAIHPSMTGSIFVE